MSACIVFSGTNAAFCSRCNRFPGIGCTIGIVVWLLGMVGFGIELRTAGHRLLPLVGFCPNLRLSSWLPTAFVLIPLILSADVRMMLSMKGRLYSSPTALGRERSHYWDEVLQEMGHQHISETWYTYMRAVYGRLLHEWLPDSPAGRSLKTDSFEEALSTQPVLQDLGAESIGIDCSLAIVQMARERLRKREDRHQFVVGDLCQLPFRPETLASILAGSSLDHFPEKEDIATSLAELVHALAPGGILIATFDNPHNPLIWMRNRLPFPFLSRFGLVPYYVGATYTLHEACQQLEALGMVVTDRTAVAHVPRAPAMWVAKVIDRLGWKRFNRSVLLLFDICERLAQWPMCYRTGYYLALRAEKRSRVPNSVVSH